MALKVGSQQPQVAPITTQTALWPRMRKTRLGEKKNHAFRPLGHTNPYNPYHTIRIKSYRYECRRRRDGTSVYHFAGYSTLYPFYCFPEMTRLRLRYALLNTRCFLCGLSNACSVNSSFFLLTNIKAMVVSRTYR